MADSRITESAATEARVPTKPQGDATSVKQRMQYRTGAVAAPRTVAEPVGVHETDLFASLPPSLPDNAPVLHSVRHTHSAFPAEKQEGGPVDITAALAAIHTEVDCWQLQQQSEVNAAVSTGASSRATERKMEQRIFGKRVEEQERAMRRMQSLLGSLGAIEADTRELIDTPAGGAAARIGRSRPESAVAVAVAERRLEERRQESAWLVQRHMAARAEARLNCERDCMLAAQAVAIGEEGERRQVLLRALEARAQVNFAADETFFRQRLSKTEAAAREPLEEAAEQTDADADTGADTDTDADTGDDVDGLDDMEEDDAAQE